MPTRTPGSRLSGLVFIDAPDDPAFAHRVIPAGGSVELPTDVRPMDVQIAGAGKLWSLGDWREETHTTSLLVLHGARIVHEWYAAGLGPTTRFLGASMSKSALAHLVGRAVRAGDLGVDDEVCAHVPELRDTGYAAARVVDLLTMTSGVAWIEDHRDPDSLASRLVGCFADGGDSRALLGQVRAGVAPGTRFAYCTADSQVLDWVRERATGRTFAEDLALLWTELGCTTDAAVGVDGSAVALAGGGLAATARDWARLALLAVDGTGPAGRLLDEAWTEAAARAAYPFLEPGRLPSTITTHAGFGYHWWPLATASGAGSDGSRLTADGSRGQFAAVDRSTGAVVVKTSLWPYEDVWADRHYRDLSYLGLHALLDTAVGQTPSDRSTSDREARP